MSRPDQFFEWQSLVDRARVDSVGSRERLRLLFALFLLACLGIFARAAQLELSEGAAFRATAARPGRQVEWLPAERGRILARDGSVLAEDAAVVDLDIEYRMLEEPPDPAWLRRQARSRLPARERGRADRIAAATATLRQEREAWRRRLAATAGLSIADWDRRCGRIQERVERIATRVNAGRAARARRATAEEAAPQDDETAGPWSWLGDLFTINEAPSTERTIVAEERALHTVVADLSPGTVAALQATPELLAGAKLVERLRRRYPAGALAANLVGHLGRDEATRPLSSPNAADRRSQGPPAAAVGRIGVERACENTLRGEWGEQIHETNQRRQRMAIASARAPVRGKDVRLTIDPGVQRMAETLLDRALEASSPSADRPTPRGGAILVMNVHNGELLAAAAAPRFDPNLFTGADDAALTTLLADPGRPLFDRATKMALPPGSVFKILTAIAALEAGAATPLTVFLCQGFLREPDHLRCAIFQHFGVGHGRIRLEDALARSCNVYFFQLAEQLGPGPLVAWAERFGAGAGAGLDLGDDAPGYLATPGSLPRLARRPWHPSDTLNLSIGQGVITATPLQVARWIAAIANGGALVTPRVLRPVESPNRSSGPGESGKTVALPIGKATLAAVREGLERTVADREGTGHAALGLCWPPVAGKTGTAEAGGERPEHAWFAGYTPLDRPEWAIVVALEHGGSGSAAAAPLARRMAETLGEAGYVADR